MVVKGSKQYRSIVVPYRPARRLVILVLSTLAICFLGAGSFWLGYHEALRLQQKAIQEWEAVKTEAEEYQQQVSQMEEQVSHSRVSSEVDKQTLESLRQEILQLNEQITELQESNNFYRQLMEPASHQQGLVVGSFQLWPGVVPGQYHYRLVVQQFQKDRRLLSGKVRVMLEGMLDGQPVKYSLHELSNDVATVDIPLRFRFYQAVEGELVLPEGFVGQKIDVSAERTGDASPVTRAFEWANAIQSL